MTATTPSDFWHLDSPSRIEAQIEWGEGMDWESIVCPINPSHQRAGKRITDLSIVIRRHKPFDFSWTPILSYCLISDSVLNLMRKERVSGFEVKPVKARFERSNETPPVLWELVVKGWAGLAKRESGIQLDKSKSCSVCGYLRYTGLQTPKELVDLKSWDGSDFFMVWPMPKYIFITERVVNIIRDHQLTGVVLKSISELKKTEGFSPGRLHYHMRDNCARRLGEPFGIF